MTRVVIAFLLPFLPLLFPSLSAGEIMTKDTVWSGTVALVEDILVPKGVTLTITPGTTVAVSPSESTKTDPEYLSPLTELTVRGRIVVKGTKEAPVVFRLAGEEKSDGWAGIMIDGGSAEIGGCSLAHAESGITLIGGALRLDGVTLRGNRYGLVMQGTPSAVSISNTTISGNDYGMFAFTAVPVAADNMVVAGNRKRDRFVGQVNKATAVRDLAAPGPGGGSRRIADQVLLGETVWQGRVEIGGIVRVPEGSRLVILPGTLVEFRRRDVTGAGIGDSGLLVQGRIIAKGTAEQPIYFRSGEKSRRAGDWDAINIMNSDGAQNLIEYCQIEDAYRGLHFHFSNVAVFRSVLKNNFRGVQFQESTVEFRGNSVAGNRSGVQGRDSEVIFADNVISGNYIGANFYRVTLNARGNVIRDNLRDGLRIREGVPRVETSTIEGNRFGLMVADGFYGGFSRNAIANNQETGFSVKNGDNVEISANFVAGNGLTGINLQEVRAEIRGNQFTDNGERGIGIISFDGVITGNNFIGNGKYSIDLEGKGSVAAPGNWWGGERAEDNIYDGKREAGRGSVTVLDQAPAPVPFSWPTASTPSAAVWRGDIRVTGRVTVEPGSELVVAPGTRVGFGDGAGMSVRGPLRAEGERGKEITFTSISKKGPSTWDEILLEHADGSRLRYCIVEDATWGIHSHFTRLDIDKSRFRNNYGAMRFRSGPVTVTGSRFEGNTIGIRSFRGNALLTENDITGNETGIFVREKGSGIVIRRNNIFGNTGYNVRVGDFNDEDVTADDNWWGGDDPKTTIFDGRQEEGIGLVRYEPYRKSRFDFGTGVVK